MNNRRAYEHHLKSSRDLVTPHEATRSGFVSLALEKNRKATPLVTEARALKSVASQAIRPRQLLELEFFPARNSLLAAAGVSHKATNHLSDKDKLEAIEGLIENFLEPSGADFVEELVYRFLLTKGDALGGSIRNLAGAMGERKLTRGLISALNIFGSDYCWLPLKGREWIWISKDDESNVKGISWIANDIPRTLIYNLTVPIVGKNVDICIFNSPPEDMIFRNNTYSVHHKPEKYIALGELKGDIAPAGADEHWKTANSALGRIRKAFSSRNLRPHTFFVGAAIENDMAKEIFVQLQSDIMDNAANLTNDDQLASLCNWIARL